MRNTMRNRHNCRRDKFRGVGGQVCIVWVSTGLNEEDHEE